MPPDACAVMATRPAESKGSKCLFRARNTQVRRRLALWCFAAGDQLGTLRANREALDLVNRPLTVAPVRFGASPLRALLSLCNGFRVLHLKGPRLPPLPSLSAFSVLLSLQPSSTDFVLHRSSATLAYSSSSLRCALVLSHPAA